MTSFAVTLVCFVVETVHSNLGLFNDIQPMPSPSWRSDSQSTETYNGGATGSGYERRSSNMSVMSNMSGMWDSTLANVAAGNSITTAASDSLVSFNNFAGSFTIMFTIGRCSASDS